MVFEDKNEDKIKLKYHKINKIVVLYAFKFSIKLIINKIINKNI